MDSWNFKTPVTFKIQCVDCEEIYPITCDADHINAWRNHGIHIDKAMSYLSEEQKQLLLSNKCDYCSKGFNKNLQKS
jgi:hypothetical protein